MARVPYPKDFASLDNFRLAWHRLVRGSNKEYKRFFSHLYPSYRFSLDTNLNDLLSEVRDGHWRPSSAVKVYFPRPTGVLRPVTLLSLRDQIVYQAIANVIGDRFFRSLRPRYGIKTFGALYAGPASKFFYRSWKKSYRAFNKKIIRAYRAGKDIIADFDLVSFFDLIDHKTLETILRQRAKNTYLLQLLNDCLTRWTASGPAGYLKGHGIPQGPEASALIAETLLADFDRDSHGKVTYVRYIDDIKLLARTFSSVDRSLIRLDLRSKHLGLVPQAQKIARRRVTDIRTVIKSVPSNLASSAPVRPFKRLSRTSKRRLLKILKDSLKRTKGELEVVDATRFKFALYRLPPSTRLLRSIRPLYLSRPDLSGVLANYAARFPASPACHDVLYSALRASPAYDAVAADYVLALDRTVRAGRRSRFNRFVRMLPGKSEEKSLLATFPTKLFLYKRTNKLVAAARLYREVQPLVAGLLISRLAFDPNHRSMAPTDLRGAISRFARSSDADLSRYCTYLMLTELKLIPSKPGAAGSLLLRHVGLNVPNNKPSLLLGFFKELFSVNSPLDWERLLGKRAHSEAQRRSNVIRGYWLGSPSVFVTVLDNFNDLLIQRFSLKHPRLRGPFRTATRKGKRIPDFENWLRNADLATILPRATPTFLECHTLRHRADVAHPTSSKTGRHTRPLTDEESARIILRLRPAYRELLTKWRVL